MIKYLQNISVAKRIVALSVVPTCVLLILGGVLIFIEYRKLQAAGLITGIIGNAPVISGLIHEMQKERGVSAGFISSKGEAFANQLAERRQSTDKALQAFNDKLANASALQNNEKFQVLVKKNEDALKRLQNIRTSVDNFEIQLSDISKYYTPVIANLLEMVDTASAKVKDAQILRSLKAYTSLLEAKERAGLERAMGAAGFGSGEFQSNIYQNFIIFGAKQDVLFETFDKFATEAQRVYLDNILKSPEKQKLNEFRKLAKLAPFGSDISQITGPEWFAVSSEFINLLKQAEDAVIQNILGQANALYLKSVSIFWFDLVLVILTVMFTSALAWFVTQSIVPPLKSLISNMTDLSNDNTDFEVTIDPMRTDEIGDMAMAIGIFRENAIAKGELESEAMKERERRQVRQQQVEVLISEFKSQSSESLKTFSANATQMEALAKQLSQTASMTSEGAAATANVTDYASTNVQSVASAAEEMTASITEINQQVIKTNNLVQEAAKDADTSNQKITKLADAAEKIGSVIALIQDIAEQTNLLALNATIEAARAGDAGKGFAVVASEVKELASQTARATEEISEQVSGIQQETQGSVESIKAIALKMVDVSQFAAAVSAAIEEQGSAIKEITNSIHHAAEGTSEVVRNISSVASATEETQSSVSEVVDASKNVMQEADKMTNVIDTFLDQVAEA